jgi:hypothetical protein
MALIRDGHELGFEELLRAAEPLPVALLLSCFCRAAPSNGPSPFKRSWPLPWSASFDAYSSGLNLGLGAKRGICATALFRAVA